MKPNLPIESTNDPEREHGRFVPLNSELKEIDDIFQQLLEESAQPIKNVLRRTAKKRFLNQEELNGIREKINLLPQGPGDLFSSCARYTILLNAYNLCLSEGYEAFVNYVEEKKEEKETLAVRNLLKNERFLKIYDLARRSNEKHPKFRDLEILLASPEMRILELTSVVFINKRSALEFKVYFEDVHKLKTEAIVDTKKRKWQKEVFRKLQARELDIVFVGRNIKEDDLATADMIIHFSLPKKKVDRIRRSNITMMRKDDCGGLVYFICLDHELDRRRYFGTSLKKRRRKKKPGQMELFF